MIRKFIFLALLLIFLSGCTTAKSNTTLPSVTITSTSATLTTPILTKEAESGIIVISGKVTDISLSARIITLCNEPDKVFSDIALTEESKLVSTDGSEINLHDIELGRIIKASGQLGESNALLANQVILLGPVLTPASTDYQIDVINTIRVKLELPELPLEFIGMTIMANSPSGNLEVALYQDTDGRKYLVDPETNNVIEIDARAILLNISPDTPLMSEEYLESKARQYVSAATPDFETLQVELMYEDGNKEDVYFFSWYDETTVGSMNRPFAQVGLHKSGVLFAYYNTLLLE